MISQDLQLYQAQLEISPTEFDRLWQFLSEDERSRGDQFKREHLKRNFVAARGNLRIILGQWLGCEPNEIQFSYSDRGKPYLQNLKNSKNSQEIYFNLAHSQDLAIYAVCSDREVGIDLEFINLKCDVESIAKRYLLPSEQKIISSFSDRHEHDKYLAFYRAWTLKEAYGKATGQGIANILDRVDVAPLLESPAGEVLEIENWILKLLSTELEMEQSYSAAFCVEKS